MSIYEYDEEEHIRMEREDAFAEGRIEGRIEGVVHTARKFNATEKEIIKQLMQEFTIDEVKAKEFLDAVE